MDIKSIVVTSPRKRGDILSISIHLLRMKLKTGSLSQKPPFGIRSRSVRRNMAGALGYFSDGQ